MFELEFVFEGTLVEIINDNPEWRLKYLGETGQIRIYELKGADLYGVLFGNDLHILRTSLGMMYMDEEEKLCLQTKNTCYKWVI